MREIKFNIWVEDENIMLRGLEQIREYAKRMGELWSEVMIPGYFSNLHHLQFTGLLDKNGKEIYEGDIISFNDGGEEGYYYKEGFEFINIAVVVFEDGRFTLSEFASDNSYVLENSDQQSEILEALNNGEIIGNIYEIPDLLSKPQ